MADEIQTVTAEQEERELGEQLLIRREKLAAMRENGFDPFQEVKFDITATAAGISADYADYEGKTVKMAGRLMSKRIMGKASFAHVQDGTAEIQLYIRIDAAGEERYAEFKKLDIGDIIGFEGEVFTTHMGEISVKTVSFILLAKALRPLPEKFHGLSNQDMRYRQRYVDLIVNPEVKRTFVLRSAIITAIRDFMNGRGFVEVDTPMLNTILGGANARPFTTHHNALDIDLYMRIAPELYLKRLIVGGFLKVYEMGRQFRNEGMDTKHNPEFTTMECYQAYTDYQGMMDLTEELYKFCADKVLGSRELSYQGTPVSLDGKWRRATMAELVKERTGCDFYNDDIKDIIEKAKGFGIDLGKDATWGKLMYALFDALIESELVQPTFVLDYPVEVSPLAKRKKDDPRLTERFEFFITSREMGNAFSELNDPIDQKSRFEDQVKAREKGDDEAQMMDEDYVTALEYGLPPTGGLGIGVDRMVMLFADAASIRDVLLFPTMKPIK